MRNITAATIADVIDAAPSVEWRLLIALGRYGGLRMPSELRNLRWVDIKWDKAYFVVHATKTAKHKDGGVRRVPLFEELRPYLEDALHLAEPGAEFVISVRNRNARNLGTQFKRIIERAGHTPWPKPWHNLRSTRETELARHHPLHLSLIHI